MSTSHDDAITTFEVAAPLFVSRPHVVALLDSGKLDVASRPGAPPLFRLSSVLPYRGERERAAQHISNRKLMDDVR